MSDKEVMKTTRIGLLIPKQMTNWPNFSQMLISISQESEVTVEVSSTHLFSVSRDLIITIHGEKEDILNAVEAFLRRMPKDRRESLTIVIASGALTSKDCRCISSKSGSHIRMYPTEYLYAGTMTRLLVVNGSMLDQASAIGTILSKGLRPIPPLPKKLPSAMTAFQKNFYMEVAEISVVTEQENALFLSENRLVVEGVNVPKSIRGWSHLGLDHRIMDKISQPAPMAYESQILPAILSGRDCFLGQGNSGTLSYAFSVLTQVFNQVQQTPYNIKEGPKCLILADTRKDIARVHSAISPFAKAIGLKCVCYSRLEGVGHVVISTPGKLFTLLDKADEPINLGKVTVFVMEGADTLIDCGTKKRMVNDIIGKIRKDRQLVIVTSGRSDSKVVKEWSKRQTKDLVCITCRD